jgi:hypothetical protein
MAAMRGTDNGGGARVGTKVRFCVKIGMLMHGGGSPKLI